MEGHKRRCHKRAIFGLKEAGDGLADGDDKRAGIEDANHASWKCLGLANFGLEIWLRGLRRHPATRRVTDKDDVLSGFDQRRENIEDGLGILFPLWITARRRLAVEVGIVDIANVELCEIGRWELGAMSCDSPCLQCFQQRLVRGGGVVRPMAKHHGKVRSCGHRRVSDRIQKHDQEGRVCKTILTLEGERSGCATSWTRLSSDRVTCR